MRPRFSLRTLLVLFALAAAACYWWVVRPTVVARRFLAAIGRNDRAAAESLLVESRDMFNSRITHSPNRSLQLRPSLVDRTWSDLWRGRRRIVIAVVESVYVVDGIDAATATRTTEEPRTILYFSAGSTGVSLKPSVTLWMMDSAKQLSQTPAQ